MRRLFSIVVLAVFAAQTTGLAELAADDGCQENCPDDNTQGQCPPDCDDCVCCPTVRSIAPDPLTLELPAVSVRGVATAAEDTPESTDPSEIFHVPKRSLA